MTDTIAIVLAGGTASEALGSGPKALVPVAGKPILLHTIAALEDAGVDRIFVFHDTETPLPQVIGHRPVVTCVGRDGDQREFAAGIRFGLQEVARLTGSDILARTNLLFISCDAPLADPDDYRAFLQAFVQSGSEVAMGLADANVVRRQLPGRRLIRIRLRGRGDAAVQTAVCLKGALLRHDGDRLHFAHWSPTEMDRVEALLKAAREHRKGGWKIPLLVYREVLHRIDSIASASRLMRAILWFALGRLDLASALNVVFDLSGVRLGVIENEIWRLNFDVDSAADLQFATEELERRRSLDRATA